MVENPKNYANVTNGLLPSHLADWISKNIAMSDFEEGKDFISYVFRTFHLS